MRKPTSWLSRTIGVAALVLAFLPAAPQGARAQDAAAFIQNLGNQAIQVLGPSVPREARAARFRQLFDQDFDLQGAARFVLGPYGRAMTPEQQQEFLTLFRENVAQAYARKLEQYAGQPFRVAGSRQVGNETVVTSHIVPSNGSPVELDWHMVNRDGRFLVTDVAVDGVSQKVAERGEFAGIVQRNGGHPQALIAALRQELAQGQGPAPRSGSSSPPSGH